MRTWGARLVAIGLGILAGVVVVLVVTRSTGGGGYVAGHPECESVYRHLVRVSADPQIGYEFTPNASSLINASGFIGPDLPLEKAPGTYRVVGIGDSISVYFSCEGTNYLQQLAQHVRADLGVPTELLNLSVFGYDTPSEARRLEVLGVGYAPDLVVVGVDINDFVNFYELAGSFGVKVDADKFSPDGYTQQHRILTAVEADPSLDWARVQATRIVTSAHWKASEKGFDLIARLAREHRFKVVVVLFPSMYHPDERYLVPTYDAIIALAEARGFGTVDLRNTLVRSEAWLQKNDDAIHPDGPGHDAAARALIAWFDRHRDELLRATPTHGQAGGGR